MSDNYESRANVGCEILGENKLINCLYCEKYCLNCDMIPLGGITD